MQKVIKILIKRDKLSYEEAKDLVLQCREALKSGDKEALQNYLSLDDKYKFDVLH